MCLMPAVIKSAITTAMIMFAISAKSNKSAVILKTFLERVLAGNALAKR